MGAPRPDGGTPRRGAPPAAPAEPYATFAKMRGIRGGAAGYGYFNSRYSENAETFLKQAEFMKNFTDDYGGRKPFDGYQHAYAAMDDEQLRVYFTWRTKARSGVFEEISPSYIFCYLYELINDIGVSGATDGMNKLVDAWRGIRAFSDAFDPVLRLWLRDYYVLHFMGTRSLFGQFSCRFPVPYRAGDERLIRRALRGALDDIAVIEMSSSFKITKGQLYKASRRDIIERCACHCLKRLSALFLENGVRFKYMLFETRREKLYTLFNGALHKRLYVTPGLAKIDLLESVRLNRREWFREYVSFDVYKPAVGYILKSVEAAMRERFGFRHALRLPPLSQVERCFLNSDPAPSGYYARRQPRRLKGWKEAAFGLMGRAEFADAIRSAVGEFAAAERLVIKDGAVSAPRLPEPVIIDMSRLDVIRKEHEETARKLAVHEEEAGDEPCAADYADAADEPCAADAAGGADAADAANDAGAAGGGMDGFFRALDGPERAALARLLDGGHPGPGSELVVESLNEKALAALGDTVVDCGAAPPSLYKEYEAALSYYRKEYDGQRL